MQVAIETLKKGELFMLKADAKANFNNVYTYDGYCRQSKKYTGTRYGDICHQIYKKKGTLVSINFDF